MALLSYSFCMSMLHSFWQAGLLLLVYFLSEKIAHNKINPLQKRNWLFILLLTQTVFSLTTFSIYYFDAENTFTANYIGEAVNGIFSKNMLSAYTPWLCSLYIIAVSYKIIKAIYEWRHFKKLHYAGLQKPSVDLKLFTALKANHFGIKRKVQLWFSNTINAPVTFGFLKPVILLPVALVNQINIQQAETLILHELTHIKANDYLLNWFLIMAENIFFFNPFIILICKKIRLEREKYCDSNVIAFQYSPILYAETLLQAQYLQQYIPQYQLAAVTGKKQLLKRMNFFTNSKNFTHQKTNRLIFPLFTFLLVCTVASALFFQNKITTAIKPVVPAAIIMPVAETDNELNIPAFVNNIIENLSDENLKKIQASVEKQQPIIEKHLKQLEPLLKSIQEKAAILAEQMDENFVTPVALKENDATRQIIIKEEQSGSKNATVKVYTVSFINGEWVLIPEWMLAAKEVNSDTLDNKIDTSLIKQ
jgi:beta-lactamase regulating signal transducer with metallopeptidase domain